MPWEESTSMSKRSEFVRLASVAGANVAALARAFKISRKTAYKWLARFRSGGEVALADRSRRPLGQPARTGPAIEQAVLELRAAHPAWGGRKIRRRLIDKGLVGVPAASTVTAILHRHGNIDAEESAKRQAFIRFEHAAPNDLFQIDFKGHFAIGAARCHPLTLVDDHSRYALAIKACADERGTTVMAHLTEVFRIYGLPLRMTMDNGSPWGTAGAAHDITPMALWLMRIGVRVSHSRPFHPQTQGKNERFNGTLLAEVIRPRQFTTLAEAQGTFDRWRNIYNCERPHEALDLATPVTRYRPSPRPFPETLPPIEYPEGIVVRRVDQTGRLSFRGNTYRVPKGLAGFPVAIEPRLQDDGIFDIRFMANHVATIDVREPID